MDRVTNISWRTASGASLGGFAYGYDALGRIVSRGHTLGDPSQPSSPMTQSSYKTYAYDDFDRLAYDGDVVYTYDAAGNRMTRTEDGETITYTLGVGDRLAEVWSNGVRVVENRYDAIGRRVVKRTPDATHTFVYDGWLLVVERVERSSGILEQIDYWWGKDISGALDGAGGIGGLLYVRKNGCDVYVPLYDGMGNVVQYVDKQGTIVAQCTYDASGNTMQKGGVKADELKMRIPHRSVFLGSWPERPSKNFFSNLNLI